MKKKSLKKIFQTGNYSFIYMSLRVAQKDSTPYFYTETLDNIMETS